MFDEYGNKYAYPVGLAVVGLSAYLDSGTDKLIQDMKYFATSVIVTGVTTDLLKTISKIYPLINLFLDNNMFEEENVTDEIQVREKTLVYVLKYLEKIYSDF